MDKCIEVQGKKGQQGGRKRDLLQHTISLHNSNGCWRTYSLALMLFKILQIHAEPPPAPLPYARLPSRKLFSRLAKSQLYIFLLHNRFGRANVLKKLLDTQK